MPPETVRAGEALFLARIGHRMQSYQAWSGRRGIYAAAVEYRYHALLRAVVADAVRTWISIRQQHAEGISTKLAEEAK